MNQNDEREAFDAKWPTPAHCKWIGNGYDCKWIENGYAATEYNAWSVHTHIARWEGWQARAALSQRAEVPVPRSAQMVAQDAAFAHRKDHEYLPQTQAEAHGWKPHAWVIDAMLTYAYQWRQGQRAEVPQGPHRVMPIDPTREMIEAGAQRLVSWGENCVWPDSWDELQVHAARTEADRCWRAMALAAPQPQQAEQQGSSTAPEEDCPKCRGSQVRGFKRGVPCAHCKGTGTNPDHTRWEESQRAEQPRQMVALTDAVLEYHWNEVNRTDHSWASPIFYRFARAIERAHGIAPGGKE